MNMAAITEPAPPVLSFDPAEPINWTPAWHRNVTSYPWAENEPRGFKRAAGMLDEHGVHIPESHCWRYAGEPMTIVPDRGDMQPQLHVKGR